MLDRKLKSLEAAVRDDPHDRIAWTALRRALERTGGDLDRVRPGNYLEALVPLSLTRPYDGDLARLVREGLEEELTRCCELPEGTTGGVWRRETSYLCRHLRAIREDDAVDLLLEAFPDHPAAVGDLIERVVQDRSGMRRALERGLASFPSRALRAELLGTVARIQGRDVLVQLLLDLIYRAPLLVVRAFEARFYLGWQGRAWGRVRRLAELMVDEHGSRCIEAMRVAQGVQA